MSSESFYSSWTGSKQVPGAVSCYRHHAGMRNSLLSAFMYRLSVDLIYQIFHS